eukprot:9328-Heterococcus_DN1.PRE.3
MESEKYTKANVQQRITLLETFKDAPWHPNFTVVAAWHEDLEALKWAVANGCAMHESTYAVAALSGQTDMIEWCATKCPLTTDIDNISFKLDELLEVGKKKCDQNFRVSYDYMPGT